MSRSRSLALLTTAALAAVPAVLVAAPAAAETAFAPGVTFYGESDFGQESGGYPAQDWFFGDVNGTDGTYDFGPAGLEIMSTGADTQVQILNQAVPVITSGSELLDALDASAVNAGPGSEWYFQVPLFFNDESGFTTLRPADANMVGDVGLWISSQPLPAAGAEPAIPANTPTPLLQIVANLDAQTNWVVLAYGLIVDDADATIHGVRFAGELSVFTPVPAVTVTPAEVTTAELTGSGVTVALSGVIPGSFGHIFVVPNGSASVSDAVFEIPAAGDPNPVADASGTVTVTYQPATAPEPGEYSVYGVAASFFFIPNEGPEEGLTEFIPSAGLVVEGAGDELAATGVEASALGVGAAVGALGLGVLLLVVLGIRRARASRNS